MSGVAKSSTSIGWGKGENVTYLPGDCTLRLCDPRWHVSYRSADAALHYHHANRHAAFTYLLTYLHDLN